MAKQTELKERGTNTLLYPVTTVALVLGTDGNPITDKVLPTKGAEGTILTVKNGAVTWDAPTSGEITSGEITSSDVKMEGTNTMLNQILTPDELTITDGAYSIYVSSSSNASIRLDGDDYTIELNLYGTHGSDGLNGHPELYCNDDLSIVTPSNLVIESAKITNALGTFEITDLGSIFDDLFTNNLTTNNLITNNLTTNNLITKNLDGFVKTTNLQGNTTLTIGETNRNYEICVTLPIGNNYTKKNSDWYIDLEGARFKKLELISNLTTNSLVFDIVDDEFYRISTTGGALYIGSETNTNEITFNLSISLGGEDIYYRSSNTTKSIKAADLDLINYIKGIGSGTALVPESEGSSKLTNTKITLNHYLDIITLNGNYSLMLDSGFVSNLPATGKHVVFRNAGTETRIITLPNNATIKSDKETLTVTAKGYAEIDLIKGSTGTILIKSSVL